MTHSHHWVTASPYHVTDGHSDLASGLDRRRAGRESAGARRRAAIIATAAVAVDELPLSAVTMTEVAARSGVVKGALYVYFPTRETLLLAVLVDELDMWFDDLEGRLAGSSRLRPDGVAVLLAASLGRRARMARLLGSLSSAIAPGVEPGLMRAVRAHVAEREARTAQLLDRSCPGIDGARLLHRALALALGLRELGDDHVDPTAELAESVTALARASKLKLVAAKPQVEGQPRVASDTIPPWRSR